LLAGAFCTALTHPLEIVKAEIQSQVITHNGAAGSGIVRQLTVLMQTGELFRGLAPRVIKKPLCNTFAFVMFEMMEKM
jgi:hypothetical protein